MNKPTRIPAGPEVPAWTLTLTDIVPANAAAVKALVASKLAR